MTTLIANKYGITKDCIIECVDDTFSDAQKRLTPFTPAKDGAYLVRQLCEVAGPDGKTQVVVLLDEIKNPPHLIWENGKSTPVEPGFRLNRFRLISSPADTKSTIEAYLNI